ncbi:hypothetical protein Tco_0718227, partial [Tanacetum coccineum]
RQFDSLVDLPACTCNESTKLKEHAQLLRLMQFLMGLDDVFSLVRSIILTMDPIPDVKFAFATLFGNSNWVSNRGNNNNAGSSSGNNNNKRFGMVSNLVCKHCNMTGHTIDRCFELVGYPPGFKRNNNNQNSSNNVSNSDVKSDHVKNASHALISDQYQRLMALLSGLNSKVLDGDWLPTAVLAGKSPYEYFAFGRHLEELHVTWDHMEKKQTRLRTYTNITQDNVLSSWRWRHQYNVTPSQRRPRQRH